MFLLEEVTTGVMPVSFWFEIGVLVIGIGSVAWLGREFLQFKDTLSERFSKLEQAIIGYEGHGGLLAEVTVNRTHNQQLALHIVGLQGYLMSVQDWIIRASPEIKIRFDSHPPAMPPNLG